MSAWTRLFPALILLLSSVAVQAQHRRSDRIQPQWIKRPPVASNGTFSYETVHSVGKSLDDARQKCLNTLVLGSGMTQGVAVVTRIDSEDALSQTWNNGRLTETVTVERRSEISVTGSEFTLFIKDISEYWAIDKYGNYCLTKLYAKSSESSVPDFDQVRLTAHYGARGLWRSALVPGLGQFYKGSNLKGALILGCTVAGAGGIVFAESMRKDRMSRISHTHDINLIHRYASDISNYELTRNLCIGAVAAIYLYNLIDAAVAPGAQRVVKVKRKGVASREYSFVPSAGTDGSINLTAFVTF